MTTARKTIFTLLLMLFSLMANGLADIQKSRAQAKNLFSDENYKDALVIYRQLLTKHDDQHSGEDLDSAVSCLRSLHQIKQLDSLDEQTVQTHRSNPQVLISASRAYHQNIGYSNLSEQLVNDTRKKYLGEEIPHRTHNLTPRTKHRDSHSELTVPIKKSGAYLVSALLNNGTTHHTVVWLDATVIVRNEVK